MPFLDNAAENFVLGQRSGFGADKAYKKSSKKKRQDDLVSYLLEAGKEQNRTDNINAQMPRDPNVLQSLNQEQLQIPYTYSDEYFADKRLNRGVMDSSTLPTSWTDRRKGKYQREQSMANRFGSNSDIVDALGKGVMRIDSATNAPRFSNTAEQPRPVINAGDVLKEVGKLTAEDFAVGMSRLGKRSAAAVGQAIDYSNDGRSNYSDSFGEKANTANAFAYTGGGMLAGQTAFKGAVNTGSTDLRGTLTDVLNGPGLALGFGLEGAVVSGGLRTARATMAAAKASGFGGKIKQGAASVALSPAGMILGVGGGGGKYGKNAVAEAVRMQETINRPIEDLRLDLSRLEPDDFAGKRRIEEQIAKQQKLMANDATLKRGDITPDVRNVTRKDLVGYQLLDPTDGTWGASIRKMTRDDIAKSLKATLKNGFERQKGSGMQPDELPDFKSKDWEDAVDRFIAEADADNLVRTTGPNDEAINWLSLANDHINALKNPDKPGSNTIDNLIASYGRLNSQMGNKANR